MNYLLLYPFSRANMSGEFNCSAAEVNAITANAHLICEAIITVSSITWFAQKLEGLHLITSQARMEIMGPAGRSPYEKCDHLLNAVKAQVQGDPSKFPKFLEILQGEDALQSYADIISASLTNCELILLNVCHKHMWCAHAQVHRFTYPCNKHTRACNPYI